MSGKGRSERVRVRREQVITLVALKLSRRDISIKLGAQYQEICDDFKFLIGRKIIKPVPPALRPPSPLPADIESVIKMTPAEARVVAAIRSGGEVAAHVGIASSIGMTCNAFHMHVSKVRQKYAVAMGIDAAPRPRMVERETVELPPDIGQKFPRCACGCLLPCGGSKRCTPLDEATEAAIAAELFAKLRDENNQKANRAVAA